MIRCQEENMTIAQQPEQPRNLPESQLDSHIADQLVHQLGRPSSLAVSPELKLRDLPDQFITTSSRPPSHSFPTKAINAFEKQRPEPPGYALRKPIL
jgi:hypothetical protein